MVMLPGGPDLIAIDQRSDHPALQAYLLIAEEDSHEQKGSCPEEVRVFDQSPTLADIQEGGPVVGGDAPLRPVYRPSEMAPVVSLRLFH